LAGSGTGSSTEPENRPDERQGTLDDSAVTLREIRSGVTECLRLLRRAVARLGVAGVEDGDPENTGFGERLARARQGAGLAQQELAVLVGSQRGAIVRYESGRVVPNARCVVALAVILGVTTDSLLLDDKPSGDG